MLTTADQLVLHGLGDYVLQSQWMANEKSKQSLVAFVHALTYTLPFFLVSQNPSALFAICGTHFVIDRWRLAKYVCWTKNFLAPPGSNRPWSECRSTGYPDDSPPWLSVWLFIIADNLMHVVCNGLALKYLNF
jgi:hypothetical protein